MKPDLRYLAEEIPVALSYQGAVQAVMMASPADYEDFGLGFSLSEGIVEHRDEIAETEIVAEQEGVEIRMWLGEASASRLAARRRHVAGPVGCGLCGLDSLKEAVRPPRSLPQGDLEVGPDAIRQALADLEAGQDLNRLTHAVHAAALWRPADGLVAIREDIGRHNALDKLAGAVARADEDTSGALALVTSRLSVDLVQKAARLGAPILVAISAPTALAVREATACGLTLVAIARRDRFEVFSHPGRVRGARLSPAVAVSAAGR